MPFTTTYHVTYKNKDFLCREIYIHGTSESGDEWDGNYTVSTQSLNREIESALDEPTDTALYDEAVRIDNAIFFFVPDEMIERPEEEIAGYVLKNLN